jgi:hypothetical protein
MKFLYLMLFFTVLNTVLSLCPITVDLEFRQEFSAKIRYLFFHYTLAPRPPKKDKKAAEEKPKESKIKTMLQKKGLAGFLEFIKELAYVAAGTAKKIFAHLTIRDFLINICVSSGDAAKTAIAYGYVCSAVYPAVSVLFSNTNYNEYSVNISPDFSKGESSVEFNCKAKIKVIFLISAALYAFKGFIKMKKKQAA